MEIINSEFAKIRPSFCSPGIFFDRLEIWTNYIIFIRILKLGAGTYHGTKKHNPPKINLYPLISQILLKVYDINFLFLNLIINFITILLYYIFKYYLDYIYIYATPPRPTFFGFICVRQLQFSFQTKYDFVQETVLKLTHKNCLTSLLNS
jgi:hypothetical protein